MGSVKLPAEADSELRSLSSAGVGHTGAPETYGPYGTFGPSDQKASSSSSSDVGD